MRRILVFTAAAHRLLSRGVRDHRKPLIARHRITQLHLNICEMLVFACPAAAVRNDQTTSRKRHHCSIGNGSHPRIRSVFPFLHIRVRRKIYRASVIEVVRAGGWPPQSFIKSVVRHPRLAQLPRQLEHIHRRKSRRGKHGMINGNQRSEQDEQTRRAQ